MLGLSGRTLRANQKAASTATEAPAITVETLTEEATTSLHVRQERIDRGVQYGLDTLGLALRAIEPHMRNLLPSERRVVLLALCLRSSHAGHDRFLLSTILHPSSFSIAQSLNDDAVVSHAGKYSSIESRPAIYTRVFYGTKDALTRLVQAYAERFKGDQAWAKAWHALTKDLDSSMVTCLRYEGVAVSQSIRQRAEADQSSDGTRLRHLLQIIDEAKIEGIAYLPFRHKYSDVLGRLSKTAASLLEWSNVALLGGFALNSAAGGLSAYVLPKHEVIQKAATLGIRWQDLQNTARSLQTQPPAGLPSRNDDDSSALMSDVEQ